MKSYRNQYEYKGEPIRAQGSNAFWREPRAKGKDLLRISIEIQ